MFAACLRCSVLKRPNFLVILRRKKHCSRPGVVHFLTVRKNQTSFVRKRGESFFSPLLLRPANARATVHFACTEEILLVLRSEWASAISFFNMIFTSSVDIVFTVMFLMLQHGHCVICGARRRHERRSSDPNVAYSTHMSTGCRCWRRQWPPFKFVLCVIYIFVLLTSAHTRLFVQFVCAGCAHARACSLAFVSAHSLSHRIIFGLLLVFFLFI